MMVWTVLPSLAREDSLPALHVEGRHLVNSRGERVIMHGFAQTFSPWFNERGSKWNNYNVTACLSYNKGIIDKILAAGWQMTFVRQHMDPYWSNTPGKNTSGENDISAFDFNRFKTYLDEVFVPMAEYAVGKGLYVVMRPPGVCPERISVGDDYQKYLLKVWEHVAQHPKLKDNLCILYELANEPIGIYHADGTPAGFKELKEYFQPVVDVIRKHCQNVVLVPGTGWQSQYAGFADYPIQGGNIGYAVHCYPGWYNGGHGDTDVEVTYRDFKRGWDAQIWPVAEFAPVVVTEMDWAPSKYNSSWGKSNTGIAGGKGFGANFRRIADETGNVSWLLFTEGHLLAQYRATVPNGNTFLTDPEACPRFCYEWFKYYASQAYKDSINSPDYVQTREDEPLFSLTDEWFNPCIWETGTFDETTGQLQTGTYGFGGWQYPRGADLSAFHYLVVELKKQQSCGASFRLFDVNNYWDQPYMADFGSSTRKVIDLRNMKNSNGRKLDPSHIYIAGFWTLGSSPIYISRVFLSDDGSTPSVILTPSFSANVVSRRYFTTDGRPLSGPTGGICIVREQCSDGTIRTFKQIGNKSGNR